jgi:hypothetical protein
VSVHVIVIPQPEVQDLQLPPLRIVHVVYEDEENGLPEFQKLVHGPIDYLPNMIGGTAAMVIHDDGKFEPKCRPNIWATRLSQDRLDVDDYICGNAVLVDVNPGPNGETLSVTPECVRVLLKVGVPIQGAVEYLSPTRE